MMDDAATPDPASVPLEVYLLGPTEFSEVRHLQRRLVYEISGDRRRAALILTEHSPIITMGRDASRAHVLLESADLAQRGWPIQWVNRGGGCLLHAPGQLAVYPVLPLDAMGLSVPEFLSRLHIILQDALSDRALHVSIRPGRSGGWVGDRLLAHVGVAVHDWVTYFGAAVNVNPDLTQFRQVQVDGLCQPMTSLERERRTSAKPNLVRQRLIEAFTERFEFGRFSLFHNHPALKRTTVPNALARRTA